MLFAVSPRTLFVCSLLLGGCAGKGTYIDAASYVASHQKATKAPEIIRVGDTLNVRVFAEPNLSAEGAVVGQTGTIVLPLLGEQQVNGLTPEQVSKNVSQALEAYVKDANVMVILLPAPIVIHVMGEIGGTGRKEYKKAVEITEVLAESGALTPYADRKGIFLLRNGQRIRFEYKHILRGEAYVRGFYLQDGDVIVVE
jgi:polysaccharide biosynthesis/export protein